MKLNELEIKILIGLKTHLPDMITPFALVESTEPEFMSSLYYLKGLGLIESKGIAFIPYEANSGVDPLFDKVRITAKGIQLLRDDESEERPFIGFDP